MTHGHSGGAGTVTFVRSKHYRNSSNSRTATFTPPTRKASVSLSARVGYSENFTKSSSESPLDGSWWRIAYNSCTSPFLVVENQEANTSVLWCNIARLWGQLTKSQPRAKNECVDQVSLSLMAPRGPSLVHCLIFKVSQDGNLSTPLRSVPRPPRFHLAVNSL